MNNKNDLKTHTDKNNSNDVDDELNIDEFEVSITPLNIKSIDDLSLDDLAKIMGIDKKDIVQVTKNTHNKIKP